MSEFSGCILLQQYVLGLQIAMYQSSFIQKTQAIEQLLCEHTNKRGAQSPKLILLNQLVQVEA